LVIINYSKLLVFHQRSKQRHEGAQAGQRLLREMADTIFGVPSAGQCIYRGIILFL
jgi:hypothetical protein